MPTPQTYAHAYVELDLGKSISGTPTRTHYAVTAVLRDASGRAYETRPYKFLQSALVKDETVPAYNALTNYSLGDVVRAGGVIYRAKSAGIATGTDPVTDVTETYWAKLRVGVLVGAEGSLAELLSLYEHKPKIAWPGLPTPAGTTLLGYRLYRGEVDTFGLLIDLEPGSTSYQDDGTLGVDFAISPPTGEHPFSTDWPGCVAFAEQRRIFGKTPAAPADVLGSRLADIYNHSPRKRVLDEDAFRFAFASLRYEEIRWLLPLRALLAGTSEAVWVVSGAGGVNDTLTALSVRARVQSYRGSSSLDPLVVDHGALVLSPAGNAVHELVFDFSSDSYQGAELSLLASHLLEDRTIVEWAFAREPFNVAWGVGSDGVLLGLSYVRDLEVVAWHSHDTEGEWESLCSVPEGTGDAVYFTVRRTVGGATKRYIERFASRRVTDARLGVFLDSALSYDGRNAGATTLTVTGAGGYDVDAEVAIAASADVFSAGDVGNDVILDPDGEVRWVDDEPLPPLGPVRLRITEYTDAQHVTALVVTPAIPAALQATPTTDWARAVDELSGLDHLEGETISVVADGNVVEGLVVAGGAVTLAEPAAVICAGLPYVSELETLDVPGDDARSRTKTMKKVRVEVENARGLEAGRDLEHLSAWQGRKVAHGYGPVPLYSGDVELLVSGDWSKTGRTALRQRHPFPVTVLGITREVELGGK
jgi:hypothetical protein